VTCIHMTIVSTIITVKGEPLTLAATDSKVMQSGYSWFRGMPGVESYVNNEYLHVTISR